MPLPRYTLRQLDAFVALAELLSFSAAADRLSLSPSAVSQLIAELEAAVGFKLFDRHTRKVALSPSGKEFLGSAESVLKHLRLAEATASDILNRAVGIVRVAAPQVIASVILPAAIQSFQIKQPRVAVRIRDVAVEQLVDAVANGDADLAVGPDRIVSEAVQRMDLFASPWVLWCSAQHPLARKRTLRWRDLKNYPLVAAGRDHERSVEQMRIGLPEHERITPIDVVDNISTALGIAAANLAATLSPAYVDAWAMQLGLVKLRVVDPEMLRQVCLYRPGQRVISPAAEGFCEYLSDWIPTWNRKRTQRQP